MLVVGATEPAAEEAVATQTTTLHAPMLAIVVMVALHPLPVATALAHALLHLAEALGHEVELFLADCAIAVDVHDCKHPLKAGAVIYDGRNIVDAEAVRRAGLTLRSIGKGGQFNT